MNYELAKALKEAGFPKSLCSAYSDKSPAPEDDGRMLQCSTLSEFIEACGEQFDRLIRLQNDPVPWAAYAFCPDSERDCCSVATTPEEAVARLWLALHKKGDK